MTGDWRAIRYADLDELGHFPAGILQRIHEGAGGPVELRQARVVEWCRQRGSWYWPEIPRAWLETFTDDVTVAMHRGELPTIQVRAATWSGYATQEYKLASHAEQLALC